jgi:glycine cleavage system H protein
MSEKPSNTPYDPDRVILYKRSRFQSRLPKDRLYTASHFWLEQQQGGVWRVGFTRFATRMLGEVVEHGFECKPGGAIKVGQTIGWVEGFKALTDVYSVADGNFQGGNPDSEANPALITNDPYDKGWLYLLTGTPEPNSVPVEGYMAILDATIDKMLG